MSPFVSNTWKAFSVTSLSLSQSVRNGKRRNNCMSPIGWDPPSPPIEQKCRFSLNSDLAYLLSENYTISLVENSTLAQFWLWSRKVKGGWIKKGGEGGSGWWGRAILDMAFLSKCGQLSSMRVFHSGPKGQIWPNVFIFTKHPNWKLYETRAFELILLKFLLT